MEKKEEAVSNAYLQLLVQAREPQDARLDQLLMHRSDHLDQRALS